MRKLILATLLMSALTAGAQGFVTHRAKVAKQQSEIQAKKAATRGQSVAPEHQRGYFFVNCQEGADAQQVARQLKANGAEVRMVKGDLILLDAPYSRLETLASTKGVLKIDVSPKVGRRTDISRKVTQAGDVIDGTGEKLPQAYTGKGVILGILDEGFDATHPMFKDKDGNLRIKAVYEPGNSHFGGDSVRIGEWTLTGSVYTKAEDILDTTKVKNTAGSHGTHSISIAAGSTSDVKALSGQYLGGMAPEADIILCRIGGDNDYYNWAYDNGQDGNARVKRSDLDRYFLKYDKDIDKIANIENLGLTIVTKTGKIISPDGTKNKDIKYGSIEYVEIPCTRTMYASNPYTNQLIDRSADAINLTKSVAAKRENSYITMWGDDEE